jgi:hypothetical protein
LYVEQCWIIGRVQFAACEGFGEDGRDYEAHCEESGWGYELGVGDLDLLPATNINPLPTSLATSWKTCSSLRMPPAMKHIPRQSSRFARIELRIAARMI